MTKPLRNKFNQFSLSRNRGLSVEESGTRFQTFAENVSQLHDIFIRGRDFEYKRYIKELMKESWIYSTTKVEFTEEGANIFEEWKYRDKKLIPYKYLIGPQSLVNIANNSLIIGLAGEEGAKKLAEIGRHFKRKPRLYARPYYEGNYYGMFSHGPYYARIGSGKYTGDWLSINIYPNNFRRPLSIIGVKQITE